MAALDRSTAGNPHQLAVEADAIIEAEDVIVRSHCGMLVVPHGEEAAHIAAERNKRPKSAELARQHGGEQPHR